MDLKIIEYLVDVLRCLAGRRSVDSNSTVNPDRICCLIDISAAGSPACSLHSSRDANCSDLLVNVRLGHGDSRLVLGRIYSSGIENRKCVSTTRGRWQ